MLWRKEETHNRLGKLRIIIKLIRLIGDHDGVAPDGSPYRWGRIYSFGKL